MFVLADEQIYQLGAAPPTRFYTKIRTSPACPNQVVQLFASKTYNEPLTFTSKNNVTLQGSTGTILNNTVSIVNSSYVTLQDLTMNYPASINASTITHIYHSTITVNNSSRLLYDYYGTTSSIGFLTGRGGGQAWGYESNGGTGQIYDSSIKRNYDEGFDIAIMLSNSASYYVGPDNTFCGNGIDIYATGGAYALASENTYSHPIAQSILGNVEVNGRTDVCNLAKTAAKAVEESPKEEVNINDKKYVEYMRNSLYSRQRGSYDRTLYTDVVSGLINGYKAELMSTGDKKTMKNAIVKLRHLYSEAEQKDEFYDFVGGQLDKASNKSLAPHLQRYYLWRNVDNKKFPEAIKTADQVYAAASDDSQLRAEMLYEKGLVYKYYLNDVESANGQFKNIVKDYATTTMKNIALFELTGGKNEASMEKTISATTSTRDFSLSSNPNPFNPSTTISFSLPEAGMVRLSVYDVVGREVAQLVNERKEAGRHSVTFNGNSLGSGMYFCRLEAGKNVVVSKILLMK